MRTDAVAGIGRMLGQRRSSRTGASRIGVAPTRENMSDRSGLKPLSGQDGTVATPSRVTPLLQAFVNLTPVVERDGSSPLVHA